MRTEEEIRKRISELEITIGRMQSSGLSAERWLYYVRGMKYALGEE